MIKNIVFDIGNVLVGFNWSSFIEALNFSPEITKRVTEATVKSDDWDEIDRGVLSNDEVLDRFIENDPEIKAEIETFYDNFGGLLKQFEYTKGMILDFKRRGFKVYCLSNMSYKAVNECADALDFLPLLNGYVLSCDVKKIKPDADIYSTFLDKYKLKAEECVFIDDLQKNIDTAVELGMKGLVFTDLKSTVTKLEGIIREENANFTSSYSKGQRIAALACVVIIVLMYITSFVLSLINADWARSLLRVSLMATLVLPALAWIYIWIIGKLTHKRTIADFNFFEKQD